MENSLPSSEKSISTCNTKFRYIIHGVPLNKKYTIEEAKWCDHAKQFVSEQIHTIHALTLKQWLGYIPSTVGDMTTTMWMKFPTTVWSDQSESSPLECWDRNRDIFAPHSLFSIRFFPQGSCVEQASKMCNKR